MYAALTKLLELETTAPNDGAYKAAIASSMASIAAKTPPKVQVNHANMV